MKIEGLAALALVGLMAVAAGATPIIGISGSSIDAAFTPSGGAYDKGVLSMDDIVPIIVDYQGLGPSVLPGCHFAMSTDLNEDFSSGGIVLGLFLGGALEIKDSSDVLLLGGDVVSMTLTEPFDNCGILTASGIFTADAGTLLADFGPIGESHEIIFNVEPAFLDDLTVPFTGDGSITLTPDGGQGEPIPEPATVCLICMALTGLALRRKRR